MCDETYMNIWTYKGSFGRFFVSNRGGVTSCCGAMMPKRLEGFIAVRCDKSHGNLRGVYPPKCHVSLGKWPALIKALFLGGIHENLLTQILDPKIPKRFKPCECWPFLCCDFLLRRSQIFRHLTMWDGEKWDKMRQKAMNRLSKSVAGFFVQLRNGGLRIFSASDQCWFHTLHVWFYALVSFYDFYVKE